MNLKSFSRILQHSLFQSRRMKMSTWGRSFYAILYFILILSFLKRFAFATYTAEADAKKDFEAINGKDLNGKKLVVDYAFQRLKQEPKKEKKLEPAAKKAKGEAGAVVEKKTEVAKKEEKSEKNGQKDNKNGNNKRKIEVAEEEDSDDDEEEDDDEDDDDESEEEEVKPAPKKKAPAKKPFNKKK